MLEECRSGRRQHRRRRHRRRRRRMEWKKRWRSWLTTICGNGSTPTGRKWSLQRVVGKCTARSHRSRTFMLTSGVKEVWQICLLQLTQS
ncbi:unnamed protein product [Dibothriocephalus latus]|uniref:Uncharacterized protein n=1 Tax=Dibothriocephalus latus TaxID=60516 RepID=A0A3P7M0X2_DIBLA|nr:unnamed protein product [Dibothriocephalus latus]